MFFGARRHGFPPLVPGRLLWCPIARLLWCPFARTLRLTACSPSSRCLLALQRFDLGFQVHTVRPALSKGHLLQLDAQGPRQPPRGKELTPMHDAQHGAWPPSSAVQRERVV